MNKLLNCLTVVLVLVYLLLFFSVICACVSCGLFDLQCDSERFIFNGGLCLGAGFIGLFLIFDILLPCDKIFKRKSPAPAEPE